MEANGAVDLLHLEITGVQFSAHPLTVNSPSFRVREPRVEGSFKGRMDTSDIARTQVETLSSKPNRLP